MSLILDALNKADHERRKNDDRPGLDSHHDPVMPPTPQKPARLVLTYSVAAVFLIALGAGAYFWGKSSNHPALADAPGQNPVANAVPAGAPPSATVAAAEPATPEVVPSAGKRPPLTKAAADQSRQIAAQYQKARDTRSDSPKTHTPNQEVAALYAQSESGAPIVTPPPQAAVQAKPVPPTTAPPTPQQARPSTPQPTPKPAAQPEPETITQNPAAATNPYQAQGPAAAKPPVATPPPDAGPTSMKDFPEVGDIRSLPWTQQVEIPTLNYSEHHYLPNNAGNVVINGVTRKRGDKIDKDLTLELILRDGVLIRYGNQAFKLPALNSWINM